MRRFAEVAATVDHAIALAPEDAELRADRASLDLPGGLIRSLCTRYSRL